MYEIYFTFFHHCTVWDAMGRFPWEGWTEMNLVGLGDYDLCMGLNEDSDHLTGQPIETHYCVAHLEIPLPARDPNLKFSDYRVEYGKALVTANDTTSMNNSLMTHMTRHLSILYSVKLLRLGLCSPRSCSPKDLQVIVNHVIPLPESAGISFRMHPECSYPGMSLKKSNAQMIVLYIWCIVFGLCFTASILDLIKAPSSHSGLLIQILLCFSIQRNIRKLFYIPPFNKETGNRGGKFEFTCGWRTINASWVVMGHTYLALALPFQSLSANNHSLFSKFLVSPGASLASASFFQLEQFFFLSGAILTYIVYPVIEEKGGRLNLFTYIAHRWLRSVPSVAAVLSIILISPLAQGGVLGDVSHVGDGPVYKILMEEASEPCRRNWWRNFFPVQHWYGLHDTVSNECNYLSNKYLIFTHFSVCQKPGFYL